LSTPTTETPTSQGTLTFLFTDLVGSTDLRSRVGDEAADEVFLTHERLTRAQIEQSGAIETKYRGDGFLIVFASARQAIDTAVAIQRSIEEHNQANPDTPIKVRMGLNSGDVMQHSGETYGLAVHAASRIADKAQGGQILVSQIVRDLAGMLPKLRLADRGLFWLKGLPARWRLFEVLWRQRWERDETPSSRPVATEAGDDRALPRARGTLVGRATAQHAVAEEIAAVGAAGLRAVILEGEAGIGKTRVIEAAAELASLYDPPFCVLSVAADEELRGPFLLFRTLLGDPRVSRIAEQAMVLEPLDRAQAALSGSGAFRDEGLAPQEQTLRLFDDVANAFAALARERPLALLIDDIQWADEESIRLIRYLVRTLASVPIFMLIATRPHSDRSTGGASNLIADMERMHLARRLRLDRFSRAETEALLESLLGAPVAATTLDSLHARAEGVPFFVEEFARAYREAKVLQLIDGTWTMTRLSGPTVPASVQSLIARRLAQPPDEARRLLADAAVLGRRFRLGDLSDVLGSVDNGRAPAVWDLEDLLQPAVESGIVTRLPEGSDYDYSFTHDQMRAALVDSTSRLRRRAIHGAIASGLASAEGRENLSTLAYHALHAGDEPLAVSCAIKAARAGLEAHAPEESLRTIDATLAAASEPGDRIAMLRVKDEALELLDRGQERMANLAEMGALTGALADPSVEMEVKLRRASAARMTGDFDLATDLARQVRDAAVSAGDAASELDACLELGQAATHSPLGESFFPLMEIDIEAATEAFNRALELARGVGDRAKEAASLRELAVLEAGQARISLLAGAQEGMSVYELIQMAPSRLATSKDLANQAFQIYEELGDRRGAMSALISTAYAHVADPTPRGMAGRLEHVRRLYHRREGMTTESQRAIDDMMMLYSIHVFARGSAHPDLALERGRQAFEAARAIGDRWMEFLAAGGMAVTLLSLNDPAEAEAWVDRAASAALAAPRPAMARRLEMWRGALAAAQGDGQGLVVHFEKAADLARELDSRAGECEALARLAMEAARLGTDRADEALLETAMEAAARTLEVLTTLPENMPWEGMAHAAESLVAQAQGRADDAAEAARSALGMLEPRLERGQYIDVLWAVGRALIRAEAPEADDLAREIHEDLWFVDMTIVDPEVKRRWFAAPMQFELVELAGYEPIDMATLPSSVPEDLGEDDVQILRMLTSGSDDEEMAARLDTDEEDVGRRVSDLLTKLGVSSRLAAASFAVKAGI
jgi:class 3 adenylate cyclase/DNA-binding CsgD family transcriptional regulator